MKKIFSWIIFLLTVVVLARSVAAAELSGTVYSKGSPVANLTIAVKETDTKTKTGPNGEYKFDLTPGKYTLVVRERNFR